jgi:uncharacterized protein (TIGR02270 family)
VSGTSRVERPTAVAADPTGAPPPLRVEPSERGFRIGLYLEHYEEAGFLYEQRLVLLDDPDVEWPDVDAFEQRLEAHLDALVLGGTLALDVGLQQAVAGDPGEYYAALCVACRHRASDQVLALLDGLDPEDADRVRACTAALCDELPPEWGDVPRWLLASGRTALVRVGARVAGYRRLDLGREIVAALATADAGARADLAWAIGRLRVGAGYERLCADFHGAPGPLHDATALTLLRLGEWRVVPACLERARAAPAGLPLVGMAGGWNEFQRVLDLVASRQAGAEGALALGLFGCPLAVEPLLDALADEAAAPAAAAALELITGAGLYGEEVVPEAVAEDELFDDEKATQGAAAAPAEDAPAGGTTVNRLTRDPTRWRAWWRQHGASFQPTARYRNGQPHSAAGLIHTLASVRSPRTVRALAAEELLVRYGIDMPFETDMPVRMQWHAIHALACAAAGAGPQPGSWELSTPPAR